jgi:hypothetical protein
MNPLIDYKKPIFKEIFNNFKYGTHILILGSTDSGKTNFMIWLVLNLDKKMVIFNPLGHIEYEKLSDVVLNLKDIADDKFIKYLDDYNYQKICISASGDNFDIESIRHYWNILCKKIFTHEDKFYTEFMESKNKKVGVDFKRRANICLLNDEMVLCMDKENLMPYHQSIIHMGRNYGISHIGLTQRQQYISKFISTMSKWKVLYEMDKYDIYHLSRVINSVEMVESLKPYHFIFQKSHSDIKFYSPLPLLKVD